MMPSATPTWHDKLCEPVQRFLYLSYNFGLLFRVPIRDETII
jgi:hypothetical protein